MTDSQSKEQFSWFNRNSWAVVQKYGELYPDSYLPLIAKCNFLFFTILGAAFTMNHLWKEARLTHYQPEKSMPKPSSVTIHPARNILGSVGVPGDKSIPCGRTVALAEFLTRSRLRQHSGVRSRVGLQG
jgi:hypothetical protein